MYETRLKVIQKQLQAAFRQVTEQPRSSRESDDCTVMDLEKWIAQLRHTRELLQKTLSIDIYDDDPKQPLVLRIQIKQSQATHNENCLLGEDDDTVIAIRLVRTFLCFLDIFFFIFFLS